MIYIIDHQDSFTWNVVHQFSKFDKVICSNYYEVNNKLLDKSDVIVLSRTWITKGLSCYFKNLQKIQRKEKNYWNLSWLSNDFA